MGIREDSWGLGGYVGGAMHKSGTGHEAVDGDYDGMGIGLEMGWNPI